MNIHQSTSGSGSVLQWKCWLRIQNTTANTNKFETKILCCPTWPPPVPGSPSRFRGRFASHSSDTSSHPARRQFFISRGIQRDRLSLLTNSALVYESQCGAGGGGGCGVSANEYNCAHHVTWSPNKLWRSNSIITQCLKRIGTRVK